MYEAAEVDDASEEQRVQRLNTTASGHPAGHGKASCRLALVPTQ